MLTINPEASALHDETVQSSAPTPEFALPMVLPVHIATRKKKRGWILLV